jgi:hypothetical protein
MNNEESKLEAQQEQLDIPVVMFSFLSIMGYFFMNRRWFRNSKLGWKWACKYHPEVDGTDEYLLWQLFKIK